MLDGPAPSSAIWGSTEDMFDPDTALDFQDKLMDTYGSVCRIKGPFGKNSGYLTREPSRKSSSRAMMISESRLAHNLVETRLWTSSANGLWSVIHSHIRKPFSGLPGHRHEVQRKTPTMTIIAQRLVDAITSEVQTNGGNSQAIDLFKWSHLISLEIIGQAGMGHSFGILDGKVPAYLFASRDLFALLTEMWYLHPFIAFLARLGPAFLRRAVVEHVPHRLVQRMKNVADTMHETSWYIQAVDIMRRKREALSSGTLDSEVAAGRDIMTALLRHNLMAAPQDQMTDEDVLAQINGLAFAGNDSTSSALSRTIHLLAEHPCIQSKLRDEIRRAHHFYGKNLDYDQLNSLLYLDAVCRESLRLHAPGFFLDRVAMKDWILPLHYPARSAEGMVMMLNIRVPKGATLHVSLGAANRDRRTWGDDARAFRPDRWLEPLPKSVMDSRMPGIYASTMTFLGGPRACPNARGVKFAQLEMSECPPLTGSSAKVEHSLVQTETVLSNLVSSFKFELSNENIKWKNDAIAKPYTQYSDGTTSKDPKMLINVTVMGEPG
ncbi:cytochrome P450 family protein [Rhizoctonia solani]|uniref:Cytochrome P450 family protein n=1 Tax=Rhizoctonia solani TaxID=456999 RepID=A0A8H8P941_9AGAM|nr:cytochrome P450 family protein [Rhizoctonia solani]QRW26063.1 cytochrome P450 family protein [Rhizoctonia solani]